MPSPTEGPTGSSGGDPGDSADAGRYMADPVVGVFRLRSWRVVFPNRNAHAAKDPAGCQSPWCKGKYFWNRAPATTAVITR